MQDPEMYINACRACLNVDNDSKYPLSENNLDKMFELTTNITISHDDNLPKHVCPRCLELINSMYNFKLQCHISNTTLLQHLLSTKTEAEMRDNLDDSDSDLDFPKFEIDEDAMSNDSRQNIDEEKCDILEKCVIEEKCVNEENIMLDEIKVKTKRKRKDPSRTKNSSKSRLIEFSNTSKSVHYECGLCEHSENKSFADLTLHLDTHKHDKICNCCNTIFYDWAELLSHRYQHLTVGDVICHLCEKQVDTDKKLKSHFRRQHFALEDKCCEICNKKFAKRANFTRHMKYNHTDKKTFPCDTCGKLFKSNGHLRTHNKVHSPEKKYICEECGFSCNFRGGLLSHISRRHGPDQKLICHKCSKIFKSKESFSEHERMHNMICICSQCGKEFNRPQMLKRHMMSHTGERPFPCGFCSARFRSSSQLGNHQRRHTGQRPYQCKYCSSAFFTQNVLIKHTRIHTGEKPYVCIICKKGFTGGHNLKVHMKVHGENLIISKKERFS